MKRTLKTEILTHKKRKMKYLVICRGDGNGIIGAACVIKEYNLPMNNTEVVITQPFLLDKIRVDGGTSAIFVVGLAVNHNDLSMTLNFADKYLGRIVVWADNHQGTTEKLSRLMGSRLLCNETAPSCPAIMVQSGYEEIPTTWVKAANALERPAEYPTTPLSDRFKKAFKVASAESQDTNDYLVEELRKAFLNELLSDQEENLLTIYGARYGSLMKATEKAKESFFEFLPGIGLATLGDELVDRTAVCLSGADSFLISVVQFHSRMDGNPITIATTKNKDLNLVTTLELSGGNPSRVIIPGNLKKVRDMITYKLSQR